LKNKTFKLLAAFIIFKLRFPFSIFIFTESIPCF
jgi:hypothetical protein